MLCVSASLLTVPLQALAQTTNIAPSGISIAKPYSVSAQVDGHTYTISGYEWNLTVHSFKINPGKSIVIDVTGQNGSIQITIPKSLMNESVYAVMDSNGNNLSATIIPLPDNANISIEIRVPDSIKTIEISSNYILPTFIQEDFGSKAGVKLEVLPEPSIDKPMQAIPLLANGTDYTFNMTFLQPDSSKPEAVVNQRIGYNVIILLNNSEIFNAAANHSIANANRSILYTSDGNLTPIHYKPTKLCGAVVRVSVLEINSTSLNPVENLDFSYIVADSQNVPEFPSYFAMIGLLAGVISLVIVIRRRSLPKV